MIGMYDNNDPEGVINGCITSIIIALVVSFISWSDNSVILELL